MTDAWAWIGGRTPPAPEPLAGWLEDAVGGGPPLHRTLLEPALEALDHARNHPGRVRESAFQLLGADALLTYACEAALDTADPVSVLADILGAAADER